MATTPDSPDPARRPRVVGMVRGGQLARMTALAARRLGVDLRVIDLDPQCPAGQVGCPIVVGDPTDPDALARFAATVDAVAFDDESVPIDVLRTLQAAGATLLPSPDAAVLAFDKSLARPWLYAHGFPVPRYDVVNSDAEVLELGERFGWPLVLKAPRGGYDGRGVEVVDGPDGVAEATAAFGFPVLVEEFVRHDAEVAVTVARRAGGQVVSFPPVRTVQRDGICISVEHPSGLDDEVAADAQAVARRLATAADVVGLMTVELFVVGDRLVVNELALRPHNSAHLTLDAFDVSQFDLLLLVATDQPLPEPHPTAATAVMVNLLGGPDGDPPPIRATDGLPGTVHIHRYGKAPRPGRKLGHLTVTAPDAPAAAALVEAAVGAPA